MLTAKGIKKLYRDGVRKELVKQRNFICQGTLKPSKKLSMRLLCCNSSLIQSGSRKSSVKLQKLLKTTFKINGNKRLFKRKFTFVNLLYVTYCFMYCRMLNGLELSGTRSSNSQSVFKKKQNPAQSIIFHVAA